LSLEILAIACFGVVAFALASWEPTPREVYTASEMWEPAGVDFYADWWVDTVAVETLADPDTERGRAIRELLDSLNVLIGSAR
jgi:hypothetical protein